MYNSYSGDMMKKVIVRKRIFAFLIDMFIVSFIVSLIFIGKDTRVSDKRNREMMKVINDFSSEKITTEEYLNKYSEIIYLNSQDNFNENLVYLIVSLGYFLIFQYLNGGASIGKSLMKIRIVNRDKKEVKFWQLLVRVGLVNEVFPMILMLIIVKITSGFNFMISYGVVGFLENLILIACVVSLLIRKDGNAIHDILSGSKVIIDS